MEGIRPLHDLPEGADGSSDSSRKPELGKAEARAAIERVLACPDPRKIFEGLHVDPHNQAAQRLFVQIQKRLAGEGSFHYLDRANVHKKSSPVVESLLMAAFRYEFSFWDQLPLQGRQVLFLYMVAHASYPSPLGAALRDFLLEQSIEQCIALADKKKTTHGHYVPLALVFMAILHVEKHPEMATRIFALDGVLEIFMRKDQQFIAI
jgi:hypothetical protein